ncbi:precorrin-6Y C5,15-methyltransferase (decarboxylating) [Aquimarina sp. EL_43]|uniref:precorrin-6y C5,15-methyltransferase (decarboxylating) subunit CbiE n=1 Tax=unclassified Aquimarina TaxID=2627091 RepID=UPI0018CA6B14|nr:MULTISPECIES: precorrin-6y C5,15-methyltransferase (decarboxylating) subunit CbiE [unclassified Aquimarina]MBG6130280.1 precorrin-6Y C5,15-methyltransferase (decarboxylating) [Aquimarina sp. EL_35]MBG6149060.1 precorrin-6Y C5,15-methyltransferase (decarboxylating) [Aquimarina sp. EL_32]MBG6168566.1 precorrin-6Y C5,15-methyltransferase (decarboxylating) [Aquimarina sp. EL_43]
MTFHIIGIGNKTPDFTTEQQQSILDTLFFSGGKRHYELVKDYLPENHEWITIQSPMSQVFEAYEKATVPIIVFASGNPLFYGFSNTLKNKYPDAEIITAPYFSSIQLLANAMNLNSNQLQTISVHGRSWKALDAILIQQKESIGVLTDAEKTPAIIAKRLLEYGYDNYVMLVGEDIEGEQEKFQELALQKASIMKFHSLNCVILKKTRHRHIDFGIKDADFKGLPGRPKMITKMPVRLTTLHYLNVLNIDTLWDIGFCTGSVSVEAKLKNRDLDIIAFEKRPECKVILEENQKRFGVPGIQIVMGDFFEQDLTQFVKPEAIFIGGHGGRLEELFLKITPVLKLETCIVINAVKESSVQAFKAGCNKIGYTVIEESVLSLDEYNPITLLKAIKLRSKTK